MKRKFSIVASSTMGLESIVKEECKKLGFSNIQVWNGRVEFDGDFETLVKANIHLRCADRIFVKMAEFKALSYEELFQEVKKIAWEDWIEEKGEFPIAWVSSVKSKLYSKADIQRIAKKAIVERLKTKYQREVFEETGAKYRIKIQCHHDVFLVMLDSSGEGLNRRGYRSLKNEAPLKETMAAALIYLAKWQGGERAFVDPMCGTGTLAIEAAMIARNIAPGVNRNFAAEEWSVIPEEIWIEVRDEAFSREDYEKKVRIYASDIEEETIQIARKNIERAGVEEDILLSCQDFKEVRVEEKAGAMITNPPYGERLLDSMEVEELYRNLGQFCRKRLPKWSYYIITSFEMFEKVFGKKANKNRKLYNGGIKCYYYQYYGEDRVNGREV
ncbi:class I SAM-dependent RNA methyltransferase [Fusobacterium necrophorum subsp. funduliforme]